MIEKRAYEKTDLEILEVKSDDYLKGDYRKTTEERILAIIETEAPITEELLCKRLLNSFSIQRMGSALDFYLKSTVLAEMSVKNEVEREIVQNQVVYHRKDDQGYYRPTPENPEEIRYSYQIPVPEAICCIIHVMETSDKTNFSKKQLLEAFSIEMGYLRKGAQVVALFNKAFAEAKKRGVIITKNSGKFSFNAK